MYMTRRIKALEGKFNASKIPAQDRFEAVFSDEEFEAAQKQIVARYGRDALRPIQFVQFTDPLAEYRNSPDRGTEDIWRTIMIRH